MAVEIRELIIRGIVDSSEKSVNKVSKELTDQLEYIVEGETLLEYLKQMEEKITKNCIEAVLSKIKSKNL